MTSLTPWVYRVERCTTDKLDLELNSYNSPGDTTFYEIVQIQYVGGRDWVVISRIPDLNEDWDDDNS